MKRIAMLALIFVFGLAALPEADAVAIHTIAVTIGATATQLSTSAISSRQVIVQNNAAHAMYIGDSTVTSSNGIALAAASGGTPGGAMNLGVNTTGGEVDLSTVYVTGTQNDVLRVAYLQ